MQENISVVEWAGGNETILNSYEEKLQEVLNAQIPFYCPRV